MYFSILCHEGQIHVLFYFDRHSSQYCAKGLLNSVRVMKNRGRKVVAKNNQLVQRCQALVQEILMELR